MLHQILHAESKVLVLMFKFIYPCYNFKTLSPRECIGSERRFTRGHKIGKIGRRMLKETVEQWATEVTGKICTSGPTKRPAVKTDWSHEPVETIYTFGLSEGEFIKNLLRKEQSLPQDLELKILICYGYYSSVSFKPLMTD